jgi:hypothetical protein
MYLLIYITLGMLSHTVILVCTFHMSEKNTYYTPYAFSAFVDGHGY